MIAETFAAGTAVRQVAPALSDERGSRYQAAMSRKSRALPPSPFRRFNSSPEVIRLVVMMYVPLPAFGSRQTDRSPEMLEPRISVLRMPGTDQRSGAEESRSPKASNQVVIPL